MLSTEKIISDIRAIVELNLYCDWELKNTIIEAYVNHNNMELIEDYDTDHLNKWSLKDEEIKEFVDLNIIR